MSLVNVMLLRGLVTATQQHNDLRSGQRDVKTIAGAVVNAQLVNTFINRFVIAGITAAQSRYSFDNALTRFTVAQAGEPFIEWARSVCNAVKESW
jgi:hypothetical protein